MCQYQYYSLTFTTNSIHSGYKSTVCLGYCGNRIHCNWQKNQSNLTIVQITAKNANHSLFLLSIQTLNRMRLQWQPLAETRSAKPPPAQSATQSAPLCDPCLVHRGRSLPLVYGDCLWKVHLHKPDPRLHLVLHPGGLQLH